MFYRFSSLLFASYHYSSSFTFFLSFSLSYRYKNLQKSYPWYSNITRRRLEVLGRAKIEPDFDKATEYFYAMLGYLDALQKIQYEIRLVFVEEPIDKA